MLPIVFFLMCSVAPLCAMNEIAPKDIVMAQVRKKEYCQALKELEPFMFSSHGFHLFLLYKDKCQWYSKAVEQMRNNKREIE